MTATHTNASTDLGSRVAKLRRQRGMTQKELAKLLGVAQSVVSDYERGELRLHGELILQLSTLLDATPNEILGADTNGKKRAPLRNRRLYRKVEKIDGLPRRDQDALLRTIDAFLSKAS